MNPMPSSTSVRPAPATAPDRRVITLIHRAPPRPARPQPGPVPPAPPVPPPRPAPGIDPRGKSRRPPADWWSALPPGEKHLLRKVAEHLRSAKADPATAAAAAKWETRLICFIKFRLAGQAARARRPAPRPRPCPA